MKPIRKAVIPAAGFGTRFLPFTKAVPKELVPVVDKPVIQYVLEEAAASGITEAAVIVSDGKDAIRHHFAPVPALYDRLKHDGKLDLLESLEAIDGLMRLTYITQTELKGLGDAILRAEEFVGGEPFAILLGDTVTMSSCGVPVTRQLIDAAMRAGGSVTALERVPKALTKRYGVIDGTDEGDGLFRVKTFVEKPEPEEAPSNLAIASRYVMTPEIFGFLHSGKPGKGGEIQLTDAMRALCEVQPMFGLEFRGRRHDIGSKLDFVKATLEFALARPEFHDALADWLKGLEI
ncbi:MAG: UTP--glucose-1-phosphate uridylyltransferase [Lentisphaeria bacterium]|nr:UTP--glucose-1-phosphate uridylyltransferase [Lentisphaeria bacterium]